MLSSKLFYCLLLFFDFVIVILHIAKGIYYWILVDSVPADSSKF